MAIHEEIKLFGQSQIRSVWDDEKEQWFFSVVDVVEVLTESKDPMSYIKKLRQRDKELSKGWGQIVTPPLYTYDHIQPTDELPLNGQ